MKERFKKIKQLLKNHSKSLLVSLCFVLPIISGAAFLIVRAGNNSSVPEDSDKEIKVLVGKGDPTISSGPNNWYYINTLNWKSYIRKNSKWDFAGTIYQLKEAKANGNTITNVDELFYLYYNIVSKKYVYSANINDWFDDLKNNRLFSNPIYTVSFYNYNNLFIGSQTAFLRESIEFKFDLPIKQEDTDGLYTFESWSHSLNGIHESFKTSALFKAIPFDDVFKENPLDHSKAIITIDETQKENITNLVIPSNINGREVDSIGYEAFRDCKNLVSITFPDTLKKISEWSFYGCSKLTKIHIPKNVDSISETAFCWGCDSIAEFTVDKENGYFSCDDGVLYDKNFTNIIRYPVNNGKYFPNNTYSVLPTVKTVSSFAFCGMKNVDEIQLNDITTDLGAWSFGGSTIKRFNFTKSIKNVKTDPFGGCKNIEEFSVDSENFKFSCENGILYNYYKTKLVRFPTKSPIEHLVIKDNIIEIESYAFNCSSLKQIDLPDSITKIPYGAFYECSELVKCDLGPNIKIIEGESFVHCKSLENYFIPVNIEFIDRDAFNYMGNVVIKCEASSKPAGWDSSWCKTQQVLWGQIKA